MTRGGRTSRWRKWMDFHEAHHSGAHFQVDSDFRTFTRGRSSWSSYGGRCCPGTWPNILIVGWCRNQPEPELERIEPRGYPEFGHRSPRLNFHGAVSFSMVFSMVLPSIVPKKRSWSIRIHRPHVSWMVPVSESDLQQISDVDFGRFQEVYPGQNSPWIYTNDGLGTWKSQPICLIRRVAEDR